MKNIFRIPVDNQHFKDTIENGKSIREIDKLLKGNEKAAFVNISKDEVVRYWGSIPGQSNKRNFELIQEGDEFLCYRSGKYIALAEIAFKSVNRELAKYSWGITENGSTWELIYFFNNVLFFQIESKIINDELEFKDGPVMGFNHISDGKVKEFLSRYSSVNSFIQQKGYENKVITTALNNFSKTKINSPFEAQFYLIDLGNQLEFDTYIPANDAGHSVFNKKLEELVTVRKNDLTQYVAPAILDPLSNIDVIWFKDHYKPRFFYEVVHKTGMNEAFSRLKAVSEHYETSKTRIIGDQERKSEFDRSKRLYFPYSDRISYKYYDDLTQVHAESLYYKNLIEEFMQ
ncbi:hypothetical protein HY030_01060 [Candidatus Gottesmanbacteria bacterium]|nr:hypothetical protein [Candidatus Gottesmanbacteria bacterium]